MTLPLGAFSLGLQVPVILAAGAICIATRRTPEIRHAAALIAVFVAAGLHFVLANLWSPCQDSFVKSALSFGLFVLVVLALLVLSAQARDEGLERDMKIILGLGAVAVTLEKIYLLAIGAPPQIRPSGIYLEPSHLALALSPLLVALIFSHTRADRWWGWISALVLFVVGASATLFIVFGLSLAASFIATNRHRITAATAWRALFGMVALAGLVMASPYREDFSARLLGIGEIDPNANPSSLIYLDGWLMGLDNLAASRGAGLGFNRMGCEPRPITETGAILELLDAGDTNFNDGSFTFAKVLSEFGYFGVVAWLAGIVLFVRLVLAGGPGAHVRPGNVAFAVSAVTIVVLGGFIRGTNYFSGPFLLGCYFLLMSIAVARRRGPSPHG